MKSADLPKNEAQRLAALHEYAILDTPPEQTYDDITRLAAYVCEAPIAVICFVDSDRTFYKSAYGITMPSIARGATFSSHAILKPNEVFEIFDTRKDDRFFDSPFIYDGSNNVISFTAVPIVNKEGFALGAICVVDHVARKLTALQIESLKTLAHQVMYILKVKKRNMQLEKMQAELEQKNKELEQFAYVVAHDIKNPISSLLLTTEILKKDYAAKLDENGVKFLGYLTRASSKVNDLVNGILAYYRSNSHEETADEINLGPMLTSLVEMVNIKEAVAIKLPEESIVLRSNKTALEQIFLNLINNAVKHNDKENISIEIGFKQCDNFYRFTVKDNGRGIAAENHEKIFDLFTSLQNKDRYNQHSTGIGLATVKKLAEKLGGEIGLTSSPGVGTEFFFTIKKQAPIIALNSVEQYSQLSAQA